MKGESILALRDAGWTWERIATHRGVDERTVRRWAKREQETERDGIFDIPVRPLAVPPLKPATRKPSRTIKALLYGDTHHPYHCERTLSVIASLGLDFKPDVIIDMGDGVDAAWLSDKFPNDPYRMDSLQEEITAKRMQLAQFRHLFPDAEFHVLEGNHEERETRALWKSVGPMRELIKLGLVERDRTWPKLLGLDEMHMTWHPYRSQGKVLILPKFLVVHGQLVRQRSGVTASHHLDKNNKSGACGHSHRLAGVWKRDWDSQHVWVETGCCIDLENPPPPGGRPDAQNGCVMATFEVETGAVSVEPVEIRRGTAQWRGKFYRA